MMAEIQIKNDKSPQRGKQYTMLMVNLESSEDEDEDLQPINVCQRGEGQVSPSEVKKLDKSLYKKLKSVEEQIKGLNFYRRRSGRRYSASNLTYSLGYNSAASISPKHMKEVVQKSSLIFSGQTCKCGAKYTLLESSSSPTKERAQAGDVKKLHKRDLFPKRFPLFTRTLSGILSIRSNMKDQAEETNETAHLSLV